MKSRHSVIEWEKIAVWFEIHTKHKNTLREQNIDILILGLVVHIIITGV